MEQVEGDGNMEDLPPVAYAEASEPVPVDVEVLRRLRELQMDGESDLVAELVNIYLADAPVRIAAMRDAIASGNADVLRLAAHTLKGSSASLGASHLAALCKELEELAHTGTAAGVAGKLADVDRELMRVREALRDPLR